jgi:hypothetical protein
MILLPAVQRETNGPSSFLTRALRSPQVALIPQGKCENGGCPGVRVPGPRRVERSIAANRPMQASRFEQAQSCGCGSVVAYSEVAPVLDHRVRVQIASNSMYGWQTQGPRFLRCEDSGLPPASGCAGSGLIAFWEPRSHTTEGVFQEPEIPASLIHKNPARRR